MLFTKITLLLLGTIASLTQGALYPSLSISNNFAVTGKYGYISSDDANGNPTFISLASEGFKGKTKVNFQVSDTANAVSHTVFAKGKLETKKFNATI